MNTQLFQLLLILYLFEFGSSTLTIKKQGIFSVGGSVLYSEGTFDVDVTPDHVGPATSCFAVPFQTSKIDIGAVTSRTKNRRTYYSYDYRNVQDLEAYTYLYQQDAIENGVPTDVAPLQLDIVL